ncbi:hypothetical protein GTO10_02280 [Candidatus Saccharibacteria bacterium]|nr:hypothetical protein [Candidatus Saccharibacteria bacterium]
MFNPFKENLIVQIMLILLVGVVIYFAGPWIIDQLSRVFELYGGGYPQLGR